MGERGATSKAGARSAAGATAWASPRAAARRRRVTSARRGGLGEQRVHKALQPRAEARHDFQCPRRAAFPALRGAGGGGGGGGDGGRDLARAAMFFALKGSSSAATWEKIPGPTGEAKG